MAARKTSKSRPSKRAKRKKPVRKRWPRVTEVKLHGEDRFLVDGRPYKERSYFEDKDEALGSWSLGARQSPTL